MKKFLLLIIVICLSCSALMAEPVSKQKALQIASQVMGAKSRMKKASALNTMKAEVVFDKVDAKGNPYLYAVHKKGSDGYVLVSGDDRYAAVLGYSDEGQFDADNMPDVLRDWIQGYIETIKDLDAKGYAPSKIMRATPTWPAINPMTSTKLCHNCRITINKLLGKENGTTCRCYIGYSRLSDKVGRTDRRTADYDLRLDRDH